MTIADFFVWIGNLNVAWLVPIAMFGFAFLLEAIDHSSASLHRKIDMLEKKLEEVRKRNHW